MPRTPLWPGHNAAPARILQATLEVRQFGDTNGKQPEAVEHPVAVANQSQICRPVVGHWSVLWARPAMLYGVYKVWSLFQAPNRRALECRYCHPLCAGIAASGEARPPRVLTPEVREWDAVWGD